MSIIDQGLVIADPFDLQSPKPLTARYLYKDLANYIDSAQACVGVPFEIRYPGRTVKIGSFEWWWNNDMSDAGLVKKGMPPKPNYTAAESDDDGILNKPDLSKFITETDIPDAPKIDWNADPTTSTGISNRPDVVHIAGDGVDVTASETITTPKTFTAPITVNVNGISDVAGTIVAKYVGLEVDAISEYDVDGQTGFAIVGKAKDIPILGTSMHVNNLKVKRTFVSRADSAHTLDAAITTDYELETSRAMVPKKGSYLSNPVVEIIASKKSTRYVNITDGDETFEEVGRITKNGNENNIAYTIQADGKYKGATAQFINVPELVAVNNIGIDELGNITKLPLTIGSTNTEYVVYVKNESELLAAWINCVAAGQEGKTSRVMITNDIIFTGNRQFINPYGSPGIKFECIQQRKFVIGGFIIDFNNLTLTRITFSSTRSDYYFRIVGCLSTFELCAWINDKVDAGLKIINMILLDPVIAGTGKITFKGLTHFTQDVNSNNSALIQPFLIENRNTWADGQNLYIEILEMSSVSSFDRFSRVLLTSTIANCPFKVSGDESWFYAPNQFLPGTGNISASASILRSTAIDRVALSAFSDSIIATKLLGLDALGRITTNTANIGGGSGVAPQQSVYTIVLPAASTVSGRMALPMIAGQNYPIGWQIDVDDVSAANLKITHNLNRHVAFVSVFVTYADGNQLVTGNLAYAGISEPSVYHFKLLALCTIPKNLLIYITFNQQ